jgi:hypothetical protein
VKTLKHVQDKTLRELLQGFRVRWDKMFLAGCRLLFPRRNDLFNVQAIRQQVKEMISQ